MKSMKQDLEYEKAVSFLTGLLTKVTGQAVEGSGHELRGKIQTLADPCVDVGGKFLLNSMDTLDNMTMIKFRLTAHFPDRNDERWATVTLEVREEDCVYVETEHDGPGMRQVLSSWRQAVKVLERWKWMPVVMGVR